MEVFAQNIAVIQGFQKRVPSIKIQHITNHRTKGAAGSWNSAIDYLLSLAVSPENTFIAILDDDDEWHVDYLKYCSQISESHLLDMTACDFYRITEEERVINQSPDELSVQSFLIGNPGIQGSNIFIRLSLFLEAGCFDENLQSCNDRDLCVRIAELGVVKYKPLRSTLMNHFAESNRIRMSTPKSGTKDLGLYNFWIKHSKRTTSYQKEGFLHRSRVLFGWNLPEEGYEGKRIASKQTESSDSISIQVGIICSEYQVISPLLAQLTRLQKESFIDRVQIVLLENDLSFECKHAILQLGHLIEIIFITRAMQDRWIDSIAYFTTFSRKSDNKFSIAQARTLLQKYIGQIRKRESYSFVTWILDEDMQVRDNTLAGLKLLPQLKRKGIDIVIGSYEYSSPNPPLNGIRTQLVDFWYNLNWMLNTKKTKSLPDISYENDFLMNRYPDYYYDLSRKHTGHLEHPFWVKPISNQETVDEAIQRLCRDVIQIFGGTPLTRPLTANLAVNVLGEAKDSVNRGGNTFIFNVNALDSVPNFNVELEGTDIRRSDMLWAIANRYYRKMNIKAVNIPVYHIGKKVNPALFDKAKVREEIFGSCLYAGLTDFLASAPNHSLGFSQVEISTILQNMNGHLKSRLALLRQSFYRVRGISKNIENLKMYQNDQNLQKLVELISTFFTTENYTDIENSVGSFSRLSHFLGSIQDQSDSYRNIINL